MVRFDLVRLPQGLTRIGKFKSAYNLFIIGPRGLHCETNLYKSWAESLMMWSDLTLGPCFKVKLKSAYNSLIIEKGCFSLKLC